MIQQEKEQRRKGLTSGKLIGLAVIALLADPELFGALLGIALVLSPVVIPLVIYFRRKKRRDGQQALQDTTYTAGAREWACEEGSRKRFCFHDDKAIHHVARGKEIDPWDRPDIDISKYQRKE